MHWQTRAAPQQHHSTTATADHTARLLSTIIKHSPLATQHTTPGVVRGGVAPLATTLRKVFDP